MMVRSVTFVFFISMMYVNSDVISHSDVIIEDTLFDKPCKSIHAEETRELKIPEYICGDGKCRCRDTSADCSGHEGGLSYIPSLPNFMTFLNFSHNRIQTTDRDDFFFNVSHITHLDFSHNGLTEINPGAFSLLNGSLTFLYIGYNNLNYTSLAPVLSLYSIEVFDLSGMHLGALPDDFFHNHPLVHLVMLYLPDNNIWSFNLTAVSHLKNLSRLILADNEISRNFYSDYMPNLEVLDLEGNGIFDFPETCRGNSSLFPALRNLYLGGNLLKRLPERVCLPTLEILELSRNTISEFSMDMFSPRLFPRLQSLSVEYTGVHIERINAFAFRHPGLRSLTLMYDNIDFNNEGAYSSEAFSGLPNLHALQLSHNYYENVNDTRFLQLFGNLTKLQCLSMQFVEFSFITRDTFSKFESLQILYLAQNKITWIPDGAFDGLEMLRVLVLDENQISEIRETTFGHEIRDRFHALDLSGNPFICSCDLRWFREWLKYNPSLFKSEWSNYFCDNYPGRLHVQSFFVSDQSCLFDRATNSFIIASVCFAITVLTALSMFYRYRWHIRLMLYEAFRGRGDRWRRLREQYFEYDVFVSYASQDLGWVCRHLLPKLEDQLGLRLCIHERDFILGENIADNIVNCVKASKKVMMLFSADFVRSQWCQFELNYCLRHVMENDDMLLVVCLHDIPSRDLTPAMMAVLKTTTYIQWADEHDAIDSFWGRIHQALNEILPRFENNM